jgi:hypothetical protein
VWRFLILVATLAGCGTSRVVSPPPPGGASCDYELAPTEPEPRFLDVSVRCRGIDVKRFAPADRALAEFVSAAGERATPSLEATSVSDGSALSYRVDLRGMADRYDSIDIAARFGTSLLAPGGSFLLEPLPLPIGLPIRVRALDAPDRALGLRRDGEGYILEAHELKAATYAAFSARELHDIALPGQTLSVALLDGKLELDPAVLSRWIETSARAVQGFYGRAPDSQLLVVLAPLAGKKGIVFGKLLPESAPGIVILIGEHTTDRDLYSDWILVHELFHVGSPSYDAEGKWFDEGLATYFEPIIRVRAGLLDERAVWQDFFGNMPKGLDALTGPGLEAVEEFGEIYWGGAAFCLLADVEARSRSGSRRGLEHGVRGVLQAGGTASKVWSLADTLRVADDAIGTPILTPLAARYARQGSPFALFPLFESLGVRARGDQIELDDTAPLANIRHAIIYGNTRR